MNDKTIKSSIGGAEFGGLYEKPNYNECAGNDLINLIKEVEKRKVEEIVNDIEKLNTTRIEYKSDMYDDGLLDMKNTILQLIK